MEFAFEIGAQVQINGKTVRTGIVKARRIVGEGDKAKAEYKIEGEKDYVSAKNVVAATAEAKTETVTPAAEAPKANGKNDKPKAERKVKVKKAETEMTAKDIVIQFMVDTCIAVNDKFAETYIGNHRVSMDGFKLTLPKLNFNAVVKRINKAVGHEGKHLELAAADNSVIGAEYNWKVKGKTITLSKDFQTGAINVAIA